MTIQTEFQAMKTFRRTLLIFLFGLMAVEASKAQGETTVTVRGIIMDDALHAPVPYVSVLVAGTATGVAADDDGKFTILLVPGSYLLRFSAIGYEAHERAIDVTPEFDAVLMIHLLPAVGMLDEVMVRSDGSPSSEFGAPQGKLNATEDLLSRVAGVDMIQRANFAWEPVVRGFSGGQVGLVIDGMKIYGACVDKMDPASSYIEPENLEKLEITKGGFDLTQASQIGGTVNLITQKPDFTRPYEYQFETGAESVSAVRRMRIAGGATTGQYAVRGSYSYRKSDDFAPGGADEIPNSGYEKRNYKVSVARSLGQMHTLTASFLGDDAWDIGYPVLLMDARLAQARVYSLAYKGHMNMGPFHDLEGRVYHNNVNHWMDDRDREVLEREVMRGMYMPMYGYTNTWGGIIKTGGEIGANRVNITLDAHNVRQFGDMWMYSLFPNIPDMYLLNLGDVSATNTAVAFDVSRSIGERLAVRINARGDFSWRDIGREEVKSIFKDRYGIDEVAKTYNFWSGSAVVEYALKQGTLVRLSLANTARLPSNVENYGNYIYNYVDGYFYTGNPGLKPERSRQVELGFERMTSRFGVRVSAYYNALQDYIIGVPDPEIGDALGGRSTIYRFRVYQNSDRAYVTGIETSFLFQIAQSIDLNASAAYTYGENLTLNDPMPMIPPLSGFVSVRYRASKWWGEVETRWAAPQNRNSDISDEDRTDGFNIFSFRSGIQVSNDLAIKTGVENIFDTYYTEHLSIGNLPSRGRNVFLSLTVTK